jgi:hypothetical protein
VDAELRDVAAPAAGITDEKRAGLLALAEDLETVWCDPATDMAAKKRLVRAVIEEIIADVNEERGTIEFVVRWVGGCHTRLQVPRPRPGQHRFRTDRDVVDLVRALAEIVLDGDIASILNRLGLRTGRGNVWTAGRVRTARQTHAIPEYSVRSRAERTWVTAEEAAAELGLSVGSIRRLIRDGVLPARQIIAYAPWMIDRTALAAAEVQRAAAALKERRYRPLHVHADQEMLDL